MGELWRKRQWRLLLNLIDHLPRHSLYSEAMASDEELAERMARLELPEPKQRFSEWTPEREALASIHDLLILLLGATVGKPIDHRFPRPVSALQKARESRRYEDHFALMRRVFPDRYR